jgi:hypothetical protein
MERILTSFRFLASTAFCCAVVVAGTTWLLADASGGARLLAASIALAATLSVMLLIASAVAADAETSTPAPVPAIAPVPTAPPPNEVHVLLRERLEAGRALGEQLDPSASDPRVDAWIAQVRQALERDKPGLVGYFDALSQRAYPDDRGRLDAHTRRLATIVRDLV